MDIQVGDSLKLKKQHPCGSSMWKVLRIGIDFRLQCEGCGHQIMIPRRQAEKNVRQIIRQEEKKPEDQERDSMGKDGAGGQQKRK